MVTLWATALALATAIPSSAGTYDVVACDSAPGGGANELFSMYNSEGMTAYVACPRNEDPNGGLVARNVVDGLGGRVGTDYVAGGGLAAPSGTTLVGAQLIFWAQRSDPGWHVTFVGDGTRVPGFGCPALQGCETMAGNVWVPLDGMREFHFVVKCGWESGCSTGPSGVPPNHQAAIRIHGATVRFRDGTEPAVAAVGGGVQSGGWVRGPQELYFNATDNSGIRQTKFFVDDVLKGDPERVHECDFRRLKPCTDVSGGVYGLDTRELSDGAHRYHLGAIDASGNTNATNGTFYVDHTAPGRATPPTIVGGEAPRDQNSFAVRWQNPTESGVAPIARAHYRICSVAVPGQCVIGSQAGKGIAALTNVALPAAGEHTLRVWLEDAAGNANEATASDSVRLHFLGAKTAISVAKERRVTAQGACVPGKGSGTAKKKRARRCRPPKPPRKVERVRFGRTLKITGQLTGEGAPVGPTTVRVNAQASTPGAVFAEEGLTETDASGAFSYTAPPGPSRTLQFVYGGSLAKAPATGVLGLVVPAKSSLKADRKSARTGQRVVFSGRLRGEPIPQVGKVVDLQAYYRGQWRTFATPRSGPRGFWKFRYKFEATRGRVKYRFRARIRHEPAYPYALGYSRQVKVAVRGG